MHRGSYSLLIQQDRWFSILWMAQWGFLLVYCAFFLPCRKQCKIWPFKFSTFFFWWQIWAHPVCPVFLDSVFDSLKKQEPKVMSITPQEFLMHHSGEHEGTVKHKGQIFCIQFLTLIYFSFKNFYKLEQYHNDGAQHF